MPVRRCPRDRQLLEFRRVQDVGLEVCPSCAGVFLDRGELERLLPGFHAADLRAVSRRGQVRAGKLSCPACRRPMVPMRYGPIKTAFELDKCLTCGGLWLDAGELERMLEATEPVRRLEGKPIYTETRSYEPAVQEEPWTVKALLAFLLGVPVEEERRSRPLAPATLLLIALCILAYLIAGRGALETGGLVPAEILKGRRLYTLITAMFLHAGLFHLLGNMYFLYVFGDNVEEALGSVRFVLCYLLLGVCAGLVSVLFAVHDPNLPRVGASGAIAGLMGAYFVLYPNSQFVMVLRFLMIPIRVSAWLYLLFWVGLQVLLLALGAISNIDIPAHLGGFTAGVGAGLAVRLRRSAAGKGTGEVRLGLPPER